MEGLQDQAALFRAFPLEQGPLELFLVGRFGDVDGFHRPGVQAGVIHAGGQGAGGGVEVLHLLRLAAGLVDPLGHGDGVGQRRAGVGGHEIGDQELVHAVFLVEPLVLVPELLIGLDVGLAHGVQNVGHAVLRGDLELAADVVLDQVGEELAVFVLHQIVEADARTDEDLLDAGDGPELAEQL